MNLNLRRCGLIVAAGLLSLYGSAYAGHGHDGDPDAPPNSNPGGGGGGGGGKSGDHPGGPPATAPGNSGGTKIKVNPPAGTCDATDASDASIDLTGPDGQSGKSHVAHTQFTLTDENGAPLGSGPTATMMYFWYGSTFDFVLNAHGLTAGGQWTLTYQPEPLPSTGAICIGHATVNGGGQLHLAGSVELNSNLPPALDPTADPSTQPPDALLALVPSADIDCTAGANTTFEPNVSLWSNPRVRFVDTDLLPAVQ